ncbi:uncharacterized protein LOC128728987 [Anopheles nili]|uniref:uncharacterized protein LOC128728987 n=1 Tax=Anopheles nili TaxID=185578 RepID=UPI00237B9860|nr:uncharacterized protein LOC128728987 [Anopheles nili]
MSADSQRNRPGGTGPGVVRCMPAIVPPQAVSDRSIIDSVAGFINDVTLQAQAPVGDSKDHILWVRFENAADISDPCLGDDWELEGGIAPPLLIILGYVTGVQVWIVPANGEAIEVLSWRHGSVKCLRVLPTPAPGDRDSATDPADQYTHKRPLIALCESGPTGGSAGAAVAGTNGGFQYCAVNFVSLKDGETVRSIKFKSAIVDILANRSSIVVTFPERIAVFDARTLEDRLTVTTCHPSPGLNPNPVALGSRWIAYAERRLIPSKRSSGGCEGDGVTSYTATVLNAAKSLGKGLRELGEQVAAGLTGSHLGSSLGSSLVGSGGGSGASGIGGGTLGGPGSTGDISGGGSLAGGLGENNQPGVVTVLDIKHPIKDVSPTTGTPITCTGGDPIVAHFLAHSEAIVALAFDAPGMLLLTADRRGHDFHVFRLHPHPSGASLAAVHHLYVLHRGDTTAKVQDISFSLDSRWVAVSTLRGTTHVFPVTPYGGPAGVRTHGSPHVVNRLSRFHRSAGLSIDGRSSSPVSHSGEGGAGSHHTPTATAYANPRTPPFPHPTIVQPLAQLRQPASLLGGAGGVGLGSGGGGGSGSGKVSAGGHHHHHARQRNSSSSSSDDLVKPLRVCASFAKARSWLLDPPGCSVRDTPAHRIQRKPVDSLFIMAAHGALIQYDLEPKHASGTPKEKICDDTPIELEVEAKAQWCLQRQENASSNDIQPPLSLDNWLIKDRFLEEGVGGGGGAGDGGSTLDYGSGYDRLQHPHNRGSTGSITMDHDDRWLSQVEIITHAGPHRRLWMGPQFMFKTYNTPSGSPLSSIDTEAVEICTGGAGGGGSGGVYNRPLQRSNPMNMPLAGGMRPLVPVLIESGSCSSYEQSPRMMNMNEFRHHENLDTEFSSLGPVESQLREDLADAMRESPLIATGRDTTGNLSASTGSTGGGGVAGHQQHHHQQQHPNPALNQHPLASATGLSSVSSCSSTSIYSSTHSLSSICDHQQQQQQQYHHQQCGSASGGCRATGVSGSGEADGTGCFYECKQPPPCTSGGDGSNKASGLVMKGLGSAQSSAQYQQQQQQHHHHHQQYYPDPGRPDSAASGRNVGGVTIAKVVNPLGTVTTISNAGSTAGPESLESDDFMQECGEAYLHENCDEALFRPVVTVHHGAGGGPVPRELDAHEMHPGRYRGSSLDRTGSGGTDGAGTLLSGGFEQRPVSQPASLIGRDLIVPVIEEKNLAYFSSSGKQQVQRGTTAGVAHRSKEVTMIMEKEDQRPLRASVRKGSAKEQDGNKQLKDDKPEKQPEPKRRSVEVIPPACEEFVNIELPVAMEESVSAIPMDAGKPGGKAETNANSGKGRATASDVGMKASRKEKSSLPVEDVSRKAKKDTGNGGLPQDKRSAPEGDSTLTEKRTGGKRNANIQPKDGSKRKDTAVSVEPDRKQRTPPGVIDAVELLPPLEALKIDDLELFGEDTDREVMSKAPVATSRKDRKDVVSKSNTTSGRGKRDTKVSTTMDTFYDPLATDDRYEMLGFVEPPLPPLELPEFPSEGESEQVTTGAKPEVVETTERTLISFESPLHEHALDGVEQANAEPTRVDQQGQVAVQMQGVLAGGNILLAMCSSLREASPAVASEQATETGESAEMHNSTTSIRYAPKQPSLEGQDSDYKSLELDVELPPSPGAADEPTDMTSSANTNAINTATIVSLLSSASEDDEDVTTNSTNNEQEEEPGDETGPTPLVELEDLPVEKVGKRRRRKRTSQHGTVSNTNADEDDGGDEEDENGDEEDEELQPLISSNKTSSSSLSTAPATTTMLGMKKDLPLPVEDPHPLYDVDNTASTLFTALPPEDDGTDTNGEQPVKQAIATTPTSPAVEVASSTDVSATAKPLTTNSSSSSSSLSASVGVTLAGSKPGATLAGGANGSNGKKKSKKKRK